MVTRKHSWLSLHSSYTGTVRPGVWLFVILLATLAAFLLISFIVAAFAAVRNPIDLVVTFSNRPAAEREPLLVFGTRGSADVLVVEYVGDAEIRFRYYSRGLDGPVSQTARITPGRPQQLTLRMPALDSPRNVLRPETDSVGILEIRLDGNLLLRASVRRSFLDTKDMHWGVNPTGGPISSDTFSGSIGVVPAYRAGVSEIVRSQASLPRRHPVWLALCFVAGGLVALAAIYPVLPNAIRRQVLAKGISATIPVAVCAVPLALLVDPSLSFHNDWFIHLWFSAYHGAFLSHHGYFPEVISTHQAVGMNDPAFYGRLPYMVIGALSSIAGPDLAARAVFFAVLVFQFREVRLLFLEAGSGSLLANTIAILSCWAIYPLSNLFARSAVLEFVAVCFLTGGVCRLLRLPLATTPAAFWKGILALSLFVSIAILTHPITAMLGTIFMAALWIVLLSGEHNRGRLILGSLIAGLLVFAIASPAVFMAGKYKSDLKIGRAGWGRDGRGLYVLPFDRLWVRLWPLPFDPRTSFADGADVSTPHLDTQINTSLLILLMVLTAGILIKSRAGTDPEHPASANEPAIRRSINIPALASFGCAAFLLSLTVSVSPWLAARVPPPLSSMQFPMRLVTYSNLSLMVLALAVATESVQRSSRTRISSACAVVLSVALLALFDKTIHSAAVANRESAWHTEPQLLALPRQFYGVGDFSVVHSIAEIADQGSSIRVAFEPEAGSLFGQVVKPAAFSVDRDATVITNVIAFPWNHLVVDGSVLSHEDVKRKGPFLAFSAHRGAHLIEYRNAPDPVWRRLRRLSDGLLVISAAAFFVLLSRTKTREISVSSVLPSSTHPEPAGSFISTPPE